MSHQEAKHAAKLQEISRVIWVELVFQICIGVLIISTFVYHAVINDNLSRHLRRDLGGHI